jgi:hypothetical protein
MKQEMNMKNVYNIIFPFINKRSIFNIKYKDNNHPLNLSFYYIIEINTNYINECDNNIHKAYTIIQNVYTILYKNVLNYTINDTINEYNTIYKYIEKINETIFFFVNIYLYVKQREIYILSNYETEYDEMKKVKKYFQHFYKYFHEINKSLDNKYDCLDFCSNPIFIYEFINTMANEYFSKKLLFHSKSLVMNEHKIDKELNYLKNLYHFCKDYYKDDYMNENVLMI